MTLDPALLSQFLSNPKSADEIEKALCERSLYRFLERAWPAFDPARFMGNWHLGAIAEHLEAVNRGQIRKLLINVSPRSAKTNLCTVAWPAWTWALEPDPQYPLIGAAVPFLCVSYASSKAEEDAVTSKRLLKSPWYLRLWGDRVQITQDRDNQQHFDTVKGGSRISVGLHASIIGRGGNIKLIDDPHDPEEMESPDVLAKAIRSYRETLSSRENDPNVAAEVIVMQRLGQGDLSNYVKEKYGNDYVHLCIPARYDSSRHCRTVLGWNDPRGCDEDGDLLSQEERSENDGKSFWEKRFPETVLVEREKAEGRFGWAGKYQQLPIPRGGGIIKPEAWKLWPPQGEDFDKKGKPLKPLIYPPMDYVVAYLDTALTAKTKNDPSGMVVVGTWRSFEGKTIRTDMSGERITDDIAETEERLYSAAPRVMLMNAWTEWLEFRDLFNKVVMSCRKHRVDRLIIEAKTAGHSIAQELRRLCADEHFGITLENPKGDKDARLHSVSHFWEAGLVYSPERGWSQKVIDQCEAGSGGVHDELADCMSGALRHLRQIGQAQTQKEFETDVRSDFGIDSAEPLYDV